MGSTSATGSAKAKEPNCRQSAAQHQRQNDTWLRNLVTAPFNVQEEQQRELKACLI